MSKRGIKNVFYYGGDQLCMSDFFFLKFVFCFSLFCLKAFKTLIHYFLLSQNQYKLVLSQMDVIHQD